MSKTKLQYYLHRLHCNRENHNLGIKLWLSKTIYFYFDFIGLFIVILNILEVKQNGTILTNHSIIQLKIK